MFETVPSSEANWLNPALVQPHFFCQSPAPIDNPHLQNQIPEQKRDSVAKEVNNMFFEKGSVEEFDALHDMGRSLVDREQLHGMAVEAEFDVCAFDRWRRKVVDLLFSHGGCDDLYYQRFSKEVVDPNIRSLEQGLRILDAARDDVERLKASSERAIPGEDQSSGRPSVSYH